MVRIKRAATFGMIISTALVSAAAAEPLVEPGTCELIVAARSSLREARQYAGEIDDQRFVKIFEAENGWFAISMGALKPQERDPVMSAWKRSGRIPQDSYCSDGQKYIARYDLQGETEVAQGEPPGFYDDEPGSFQAHLDEERAQEERSSRSTPKTDLTGLFIGILANTVSSSLSSSSGSASASSLKLGCEFVCEGQFGSAKSSAIRVNTPYTNFEDAHNYVRQEYKDYCSQNYPFYGSSGTGAFVGYPKCETYYYE